MPIWKIDGLGYLDAGSVVITGDAVVEVSFPWLKGNESLHQVALKFRSDDGETEVRFGSPRPDRTVVHFVNFPTDTASAAHSVQIGQLANGSDLYLDFAVVPYETKSKIIRTLTYTLHARSAD